MVSRKRNKIPIFLAAIASIPNVADASYCLDGQFSWIENAQPIGGYILEYDPNGGVAYERVKTFKHEDVCPGGGSRCYSGQVCVESSPTQTGSFVLKAFNDEGASGPSERVFVSSSSFTYREDVMGPPTSSPISTPPSAIVKLSSPDEDAELCAMEDGYTMAGLGFLRSSTLDVDKYKVYADGALFDVLNVDENCRNNYCFTDEICVDESMIGDKLTLSSVSQTLGESDKSQEITITEADLQSIKGVDVGSAIVDALNFNTSLFGNVNISNLSINGASYTQYFSDTSTGMNSLPYSALKNGQNIFNFSFIDQNGVQITEQKSIFAMNAVVYMIEDGEDGDYSDWLNSHLLKPVANNDHGRLGLEMTLDNIFKGERFVTDKSFEERIDINKVDELRFNMTVNMIEGLNYYVYLRVGGNSSWYRYDLLPKIGNHEYKCDLRNPTKIEGENNMVDTYADKLRIRIDNTSAPNDGRKLNLIADNIRLNKFIDLKSASPYEKNDDVLFDWREFEGGEEPSLEYTEKGNKIVRLEGSLDNYWRVGHDTPLDYMDLSNVNELKISYGAVYSDVKYRNIFYLGNIYGGWNRIDIWNPINFNPNEDIPITLNDFNSEIVSSWEIDKLRVTSLINYPDTTPGVRLGTDFKRFYVYDDIVWWEEK